MNDQNMNSQVRINTHADTAALDTVERKLTRLGKIVRDFSNTPVAKNFSKATEDSEQLNRSMKNGAADWMRFQRSQMQSLREQFSFESRMRRQAQSEARQQAAEEKELTAEQIKQAKDVLAVSMASVRQQQEAERDAANEAKRSANEKARAERDARREAAASVRADYKAIREKMSFSAAMDRQRRQEESHAEAAEKKVAASRERVAKAAAAAEAKAARDSANAWKAASRSMHRAMSRGRETYGQASDLSRGVVGGSVGAAAAVTAGGIRGRMAVDTAETSLRIFGDNDGRKFTQKDIEGLRSDWLDNTAFKTGNSITETLNAFTEINKAGIKNPKENTELLLKATSALETSVPDTTKLLALINRNLGAKSTPQALQSALNAVAVAAREDPTQAPEIVEGMKRGFGALSMGNMSPEDLAAFVSGGQSVGIQPGKAGTFIASMMKNLTEGGYAHGQRFKDLNKASSLLGFGNARNLAQQATRDSTGTIFKVLERLKSLPPELRQKATALLSQTQWSDEDMQLVNGLDGLKSTFKEINDPENKDFLEEASAERMQSWEKQWARSKAIFGRFWESIGEGFDDIYRTVNGYFYDSATKFNWKSVTAHVRGFLNGFVNGLGFGDIRQLLESAFGKPGEQNRSAIEEFKAFGRGLGTGLRSIFDAVKGLMLAFTGGQSDPETIGRLTGKIIGLSAALIVIAPVVSVLGALGTAIGTFASIVAGAAGVMRAAGLMGGAGAAGAAAGAGSTGAAAGGAAKGALGALSRLAPAFSAPLTMDPSKADRDRLDKRLGAWALEQERNKRALDRNTDALIQKQSYDGEGSLSGLIHKASLSSTDVQTMGARVQLAALNSGSIARAAASGSVGSAMSAAGIPYTPGAGGSALYGSTPGNRLPEYGVGPRYGMGPGAPGAGSPNQGSASSNPANSAASAQMLDAIASTESGKAGYDAVLGNGKYGTPSKPVSQMTLDEAYAFGRQVRARHGSSSALGRYQIVGSTMRAAMKAMKIPGNAKFDQAMQDRMARWIARNQGLGAWEGLKHNPGAMARARAAMAQGGAQDTPGGPAVASVGPGLPEAALGSVPGTGRSSGHIDGQIDMEGQRYDFGSGGHRGANSIPAGTYPITPDAIGPWGRAHGAIGINGNKIWDSTLGRYREGIEFHAASSASKLSAGCIAIARGQYAKFRAHVLDVIRRQGSAYLTVGEDGRAQIVGGKAPTVASKAAKALGAGVLPKANDNDDAPYEDIHGDSTVHSLAKELKYEKLAREAPSRPGGFNRGNGGTTHAPITINGAGQSPETTAAAVQRHLTESGRYQTQDQDFESI